VGENIRAQMFLNSLLDACEGQIELGAVFYDQETGTYGDPVNSISSNVTEDMKKEVVITIPISELDVQIGKGFAHETDYDGNRLITSTI